MQLFKESTTFISREAVLEEMETWVCCSEGERKMLEITKEWLRDYPAADVRENVRRKWIKKVLGSTSGYGTTVMYKCSECERMSINKYKFCPNCGADMRGEEE